MIQSDKEAETIKTYDANARHWTTAHSVSAWGWAADRLRELLSTGKILEVGCGGGRDAQELIDRGYEYLGTDASAGMLAAAKANAPMATFQQCNVYDLATLPHDFDGFWACAVLLHIPKARINEALQAISATLKPGAIGMISMKDGDKEEFEVRDKDGQHEERLFSYWRKEEFEKALNDNGFRVADYVYKPKDKRTKWHVFFVVKA